NDDQDVQVIHPHIFKYYPLSSGKKNGFEKKVSKFLKDALVKEQTRFFADVFNKQGNEDLLVYMILNHLDELKKQYETRYYQGLLPELSRLFTEDFIFISQYRDFFSENFQMLLQHYYFFYTSQLTFKFEQFDQADYSNVNALYY